MVLTNAYLNKHCLVIDDFAEARHGIRQMLRSIGVEKVDSVANAKTALEFCTRQRYDIIVSDYHLGSGKDGQQLLEELRFRKLLRHSCIYVMISAENSQTWVLGALENQPDCYLTKPFNKPTLKARLDRIVAFKEAASEVNEALDIDDPERVVQACVRALKSATRHQQFFLRTLAEQYYNNQRYEQALSAYQRALQDRAPSWARLGLGKVQFRLGQYENAQHTFGALIKDNEFYLEAYDWLAKTQEHRGDRNSAQNTLEEATRKSPRAIRRQMELGRIARRNRDHEIAAKAFEKSSKLGLNSVHQTPNNELNWARSLTDLADGQPKELANKTTTDARRVVDETVKTYPGNKRVKVNTAVIAARILKQQEKTAEANRALDQARELMRHAGIQLDEHGTLDLANAHLALGDEEEGKRLLIELACADHENQALAEEIKEKYGSDILASRHQALESANARGMGFYRRKQYQEAAAAFEEGLAESPNNIAINLNLAQALITAMRNGRRDDHGIQRASEALSIAEAMGADGDRMDRLNELKRLLSQLRGF